MALTLRIRASIKGSVSHPGRTGFVANSRGQTSKVRRGRRPTASGAPLYIGAFLTVATLVLGACGGPFPQSALDPASDFAWKLQDLFQGIFFWAVVVFVLVEGALIVAILRFRERPGRPGPKATHGNTILEISWTLAPAVILVLIAIPTIKTIWDVDRPARGESLVVQAIGHQWWWEFRYPELGVVTANELHIPVGQQIDVRLTSADVIHSFWFPRLGGKRDVIPGHENQIWFTADSAGLYLGPMRGVLRAVPRPDEDAVGGRGPGGLRGLGGAAARRRGSGGFGPVRRRQPGLPAGWLHCVSRGSRDHRAGGIGPDLTHVGGRRRIAAGILDNTPENLERWIRHSRELKPGSLMVVPELDDDTLRRIVTYLQGLK